MWSADLEHRNGHQHSDIKILETHAQEHWCQDNDGCCRIHGGGRTRFTWEQEERSTIVSCPVTVLSLQVAVEVHPFQSCIYSRVSSWGARHKLTLWRKWMIRNGQTLHTTGQPVCSAIIKINVLFVFYLLQFLYKGISDAWRTDWHVKRW